MKKLRLALSDAAIADILEQSDWYETQPFLLWRFQVKPRSGFQSQLQRKDFGPMYDMERTTQLIREVRSVPDTLCLQQVTAFVPHNDL